MLPLRPLTQQPKQDPKPYPQPRNYSPEFTKMMNDPVLREQNRLKATENSKAENKLLTWKQKKFIAYYLADSDRNASKCAQKAGYKGEDGSWLVRHPQLKAIIDAETRKDLKKLDITRERVLQEVATLAFSNLEQFLTENPERPGEFGIDLNKASIQQIAAVKDYTIEGPPDARRVKIQLYDKFGPLTKLGNYLKLFEEANVHKHTISIDFFDALLNGKASVANLDNSANLIEGVVERRA